jgi:hypothetical protein
MVETLREIVEVHTAGSPVEPGRLWTNRSARVLCDELNEAGFSVCPNTVDRLLHDELDLGRRQMVKTLPMGENKDRDAQFQRMTELKAQYFRRGWPVLSVDTKKKELLGNFFRPGTARTDGQVRAFDHDFPSAADGKVIPYGVYDLATNEGFVLLATGADTAELACDAIRRWWFRLGRSQYADAGGILLLADCGGSNGYRLPLFHERLCGVASRLEIPIRVAHLPPYCSKYNPIDHRLFCHLGRSLRSVICRSMEIVRDALTGTTSSTGLRVVVETARRVYHRGVKASDEFLNHDPIIRDDFLPAFNYTAPVLT